MKNFMEFTLAIIITFNLLSFIQIMKLKLSIQNQYRVYKLHMYVMVLCEIVQRN